MREHAKSAPCDRNHRPAISGWTASIRVCIAQSSQGQIQCDRYDHTENGVELYDEDDEFVAFVPYANLHALEDFHPEEERSIM